MTPTKQPWLDCPPAVMPDSYRKFHARRKAKNARMGYGYR